MSASSGGGGWPHRRFSQAIAEGDGISVIPVLHGDLSALAAAAEEAGADALAVETIEDVTRLRTATDLPVLVLRALEDRASLQAARDAGADACVLSFAGLRDDAERLLDLAGAALELGLDCGLEVCDEAELEEALELLDPEILVLSERRRDEEELETEVTLDLLPDVPAGKLVVSDSGVTTREQVLELERAGVDAVLVAAAPGGVSFPRLVAELTGRA